MKTKAITGIVLTLLLTGMLTLAFSIQPVEASGTIYIRADGSVDPPTAPISSVDNVTYTFTDNIYDDIVVERDNIVVDGAGYTLQGTGSGTGIDLTRRSNVTIKNTEIKSFEDGILLYSSSNNTISGNTVTNNVNGIVLGGSSNYNTISGNNITANNGYGILLLKRSNYNSISGNNITNNGWGVRLDFSSNYNSISGNNITSNGEGILLLASSNNRFYHNNFIDNTQQVYIATSGYANFWDNGYPSGGNYWSDYTGVDSYSGPYQNETGSDGIGDTPYAIDGDNQDNYPFMSENGWRRKQVETTDEYGERKDVFDIPETVYIRGSGYSPRTIHDLHIVEDTAWSGGMDIPDRVSGTETSVTTDENGNIPAGTAAWNGSLTPGRYDIVIDVNGNGKYDEDIDALDDEDIEVTAGFFVIPEYSIGTILALTGCFAAFGAFRLSKAKRWQKPSTSNTR